MSRSTWTDDEYRQAVIDAVAHLSVEFPEFRNDLPFAAPEGPFPADEDVLWWTSQKILPYFTVAGGAAADATLFQLRMGPTKLDKLRSQENITYTPFHPSQVEDLYRLGFGMVGKTHMSLWHLLTAIVLFQRDELFRASHQVEIPTPDLVERILHDQKVFAQEHMLWPTVQTLWLIAQFFPDQFISPADYLEFFSTDEKMSRAAEAYTMGITQVEDIRTYVRLPKDLLESLRSTAHAD